MRLRMRMCILVGCVGLIGAFTMTYSALASRSGVQSASCDPYAPGTDVHSDRTSTGSGLIGCQSPQSYYYYVSMLNASGNTLISKEGYFFAEVASFATPRVGCAGAWVHGFIYVNHDGAGKSNNDQSSTFC
jgi:hypothetical protein